MKTSRFLPCCVAVCAIVVLMTGCSRGPSEEEQKMMQKFEQMESRRRKNRDEPFISFRYRRGEYLIYDCSDRHFACVNADSFKKCKDERETAKSQRQHLFPCAPLKKFKTQKECFKAYYQAIHQEGDKSFCINPR